MTRKKRGSRQRRATARQERLPKGCTLEKDKKYLKRPSPSYKASNCPGTTLKGNDGKYWLSIPDKNSVYHWKKFKHMYETKSPFEYYAQFSEQKKPKYNYKSTVAKLKKVELELLKYRILMPKINWQSTTNFGDDAWENAEEYMLKNPRAIKIMKIKQQKDKERILANSKKYSKAKFWKDGYKLVKKRGKYSIEFNNHPAYWVSFVFYTPYSLYWATINGNLYLQHRIKDNDKKIVIDIFKKYFGKKFKWNGSMAQAMLIKL